MKKRYFIEHWEDSVWMGYLEVKEEDIEKVIDLAGTVHVPKDGIEDIERYQIESELSDQIMDVESAEDYVFLDIKELTRDERMYLFEEELNLADLEATEDIDLDELTDEEYKNLAIEVLLELEQSIIEKMKADAIDGRDMEWYEVYRWWDGSNWRTELLSHYLFGDTMKEVTEELEGLKDIDSRREKYGEYNLYLLKDGRRMIEYHSYWQGHGSKICIIDEEVDTVEDAVRIVEEKDRRLFPEKYMMG